MTYPANTTVEVRLTDSRTWQLATVAGTRNGMTTVVMQHSGNDFDVTAAQIRDYVAPAPVATAPNAPCGDCGAPSTLDGHSMSCCDPCAEKRNYDF